MFFGATMFPSRRRSARPACHCSQVQVRSGLNLSFDGVMGQGIAQGLDFASSETCLRESMLTKLRFMKEMLDEICNHWGKPTPALGGFDLSQLPLPQSLVIHPNAAEYFAGMVPIECTDTGIYELLGPKQIISENTGFVPGCDLCPKGFVTIATDGGGNSVSIDMETGELMQFSHEVNYQADEIRWWMNDGWQSGPNKPETIRKTAELTFIDVTSFLEHWRKWMLEL